MANVEAVASPQGTKRTRDDVEAEDAAQNTNTTNQDDDGKHATTPTTTEACQRAAAMHNAFDTFATRAPSRESEGPGLSLARPIRREALCIATAPQRAPLEIES